MATRDTYEMQTWENLPSETTPVNAERLTHIEQGIKDAADKRALKEIYDDNAINLGRYPGSTIGGYSTAEGQMNVASGNSSHAEGFFSKAEGNYSHSGGMNTIARGTCSCAEGLQTLASGDNSHAEGNDTIAAGESQHVSGKYNLQDNNNQYSVIVGGGTSGTDRKNIHTMDWTGNAYFAGDVTNGASVSINSLNEKIVYMTYEETAAALTSQETVEINKIPNVYAIRDWCKQLTNPDSGI